MNNPKNLSQGFTLVEMLTVLTIMAIVSVLAIPALQGLGGASNLTTAGNTVANIVDSARDEAIAHNRPTAVVFLTDGANSAYRVLTILEYSPAASANNSATWTQASKWYVLPPGIYANNGTDDSGNPVTPFLPPLGHSPIPAVASLLPPLSYLNTNYSPNIDYGYFIFLENGSVFHDANGLPSPSCKLRLTSGILTAANTLQVTGAKDALGKSANYYDIIVNDSTGRTLSGRP